MLWEICTIFCSTHVRPGDPLAECSNIKFEITSNESHITEARQYCRAQSHSRPVTGDRLVYDKGDKLSIDRRSLNSNHRDHLVEFFPTFSGRAPRIRALWETQAFITSSLSHVTTDVSNTVCNWFQTSATGTRCLKHQVFETPCPPWAAADHRCAIVPVILLFIYLFIEALSNISRRRPLQSTDSALIVWNHVRA